MKHWNTQKNGEITSISLRQIVWILYCNKEMQKDMIRLEKEKLTEEEKNDLINMIKMENEYDLRVKDKTESEAFANFYSECRAKLEEMFKALFGYHYGEVWKKSNNKYVFDTLEQASFIEYLIYIYPLEKGKKIRNGAGADLEWIDKKKIIYGVEQLASSSNFMLNKDEVIKAVKEKVKYNLEWNKVQEENEERYYYIKAAILSKDLKEEFYDAYNEIAQILEESGNAIKDIWEKCTLAYRDKHKAEIDAELKEIFENRRK